MRRNTEHRVLHCVTLTLALGACGGPDPGRDIGPFRHVVLISLDTFRADHLGSYGAARPTPRIDALAADGVRFSDVTAPAPTTLASHTSMMTGSWPHTHGVPRNGFVLSRDNVTLAEILRDAGFHTAAVLGSFALESRFRFDQGFEHFDETFDILPTRGGNEQSQRLGANVTRAALAHLDAVAGEAERVFLFAHYFDAHATYAPPPEYAARMTGDAQARSGVLEVETTVQQHQRALTGTAYGHSGVIVEGFTGPRARLLKGPPQAPSALDLRLADLYAGEVAYLDDCIGDLIDGLRARDMLDDTVIVLTGDHGESFWEHGDFWNHGLWVYDTTVRVPFIMRLPDGRGKGTVVDTPISTVDLVPTLCELLQLDLPPRCEGTSLVPAVDGKSLAHGPVFSEATQPWKVESRTGWANAPKPQCVRSGNWKYMRCRYNGIEELFDLTVDPLERRNLLQEQPLPPAVQAKHAELRALLDAWNAEARPLPSRFDPSQRQETLRILGSLGYSGDSDEDE